MTIAPPRAARRPHRHETHGDVRVDDYHWLRERDDPEVRAYLEAENAHLRESMAATADLERRLFEEIRGRIRQTDMSVPFREGRYRYYHRFEDGREYPIHCRQPVGAPPEPTAPGPSAPAAPPEAPGRPPLAAPGGPPREAPGRPPPRASGVTPPASADEEVLLDVNEVAEGQDFCQVGSRAVSPGGRLLAYAVDTVGRREYAVRVRDLARAADLPDVIANVTANVTWAAGEDVLFYGRHDPTTLRPYQILRHRLGDDPARDLLVHEEADPTFSCAVWRSRSKRYVLIGSFQTITTEIRYLDAADPDPVPAVFLARERGHEYEIDHYRGRFYIRSNAGARNFRLLETDEDRTEQAAWRELLPHRDDVLVEGFELFRDHLVVAERHEGLTRLRVSPWRAASAGGADGGAAGETEGVGGGGGHHVSFDEAAYAVWIGTNREPDTATLRFEYSSLATPRSVYDYDMTTRTRTLLKREEVLGDFDPARYQTRRVFATARDGVRVPISLVRRRGAPAAAEGTRKPTGGAHSGDADGGPRHRRTSGSPATREGAAPGGGASNAAPPLLLYGYGAYGISMEPTFRSSRLSLLDRGFTYAIAHVRGGEELGRRWYEDGKLRKKENTFTDFVACAEHLVAEGLAVPERLFAMGGSAGGLLMGAVINRRPELFHGVVAQVPFVDVLTTMLDDSIPLTTGEYDEWGNPNDPDDYACIRAYSPYDNMAPVTWPHLLVMTGLHDSQVQYWEPAKWVAKRRTMQPADGRRLLLRTNLEAGHGGASGRYRQYRETALQYAFLLDLAGVADRRPAGV